MENGIRCCNYIDDYLMTNQTLDTCQEYTNKATSEFKILGFTINNIENL